MAGEAAHDRGRDGVSKAKNWLNMTTRVHQSWTHNDQPMAELLEFSWPHGDKGRFSFDLGGTFRGGDVDGESFVAEIKNYRKQGDLPTHYRRFLAKAYVALGQAPRRCDHFLWISWAPFNAAQWDQHQSTESVSTALLEDAVRERCFGDVDAETARASIDPERVVAVSNRVWLITMNGREEHLTLTREHFRQVAASIAAGTGS